MCVGEWLHRGRTAKTHDFDIERGDGDDMSHANDLGCST